MKFGEAIVLAIVIAIVLTLIAIFINVILSADIPTWLKWMILFK